MDIISSKNGLDKSIFNDMFLVNSIGPTRGSVTKRLISELYNDLAISTPILKMVRDIAANELELFYTKKSKQKIDKDEILERINNIAGFEDFVVTVSQIPFTEFCIHEKVYGVDEHTGNLVLQKLIQVPRDYVEYDTLTNEKGWYINGKKGRIPINDEDFIVSVYGQTIEYPMGYGFFRFGLIKAFNDLQRVENKLRAIQNKYGDVIPVFGYEPSEIESEEGKANIKAKVDAVTLEKGVKAIAIPLGGYNTSLKDGFQFISLADLNLTMHITLTEKYEDQIEKFLMGAKFSRTDSGSQAKDAVAQDEKGKMLKQIGRTVIAGVKEIIKADADLFGYNYKEIKPKLVEPLDREKQLEIDKTELENEAIKLENMVKTADASSAMVTAIAHLKFNNIPDIEISELTGVKEDIITYIKPQERPLAQPEGMIGNRNTGSKGFISEFSKKKRYMNLDKKKV